MSADERRERLLDAAVRLMTRDGVAAATTRAVAAEAGMRVSTFHYCFASRDEMIALVVQRLSASERLSVDEALGPGKDLRATMADAAEGFLQHLVAHPGHEQVLFELNHLALRSPGLEHLAAAQYAMYHEAAAWVLQQVADLSGSAWAVPVPDLARLVVTVTDGVTTTWLADRDTGAARATLTTLLDLLLTHAAHGTDRTR
ncbi:TetR/AcrR family transcriptional regulator [Angustibacter speluncae]